MNKEIIKQRIKLLLIFIAITVFACIPYITLDTIQANDSTYHIQRIFSIAEEMKMGNFPVLIHSRLLDGFGYANPLFYPELFLYIPGFMVFFGLGGLFSYKFFIMLITFVTVLITYYSANIIFKDRKKCMFMTILYTLCTYRLGDVYVRGALGEIQAFAFLPLVLAGLYEIIFGENKKWWLICFGIWGIINSHVITSVFVLGLILIFCLINIKRIFKEKSRLKNLVIAGCISIILSTNVICPYLEQVLNDEFRYSTNDNAKFLYNGASSLQQLLRNEIDGVGENFSKGLLLLIFSAFIFRLKDIDKKKDAFLLQCFGIGVFTIILSSKLLPWDKMTFLSIIQFPFRFSILTAVLLTFVSAEVIVRNFKTKEMLDIILIIIIFVVGEQLSTINTNVNGLDYDRTMKWYPEGNQEYAPKHFDDSFDFVCYVEDEPEIELSTEGADTIRTLITKDGSEIRLDGILRVKNPVYDPSWAMEYTKTGTTVEFEVTDTERDLLIHVPLTYYKGYHAYYIDENGEEREITLEKEERTANIVVSSDERLVGKIVVRYEMTLVQRLSYITAAISIITFSSYVIYVQFIRKNKMADTK